MFKKFFCVLFGPRRKKPNFVREWENQRFQPPLEWTKHQSETFRWLTSIENDQRKRARGEAGSIVLSLEKETPDRGDLSMKVFVHQIEHGERRLSELGTILISPDGEIAQGNEMVSSLLMAARSTDPLRPPGLRSLG